MSAETVVIHYRRPPDREQQFTQQVIDRSTACVVTLLRAADLAAPKLIDGAVALEPGAPVIWFTFPNAWHDIGRFHTRAGAFTGYYANVLTPVSGIATSGWETTDLFLDVWQPRDGACVLLDEDELEAAHAHGWVEQATYARARAEAASLLAAAATGSWPPPVVDAWPLERVLRHVAT